MKKSLTSAGILYEIIGNGSTVLRQTPEKGSVFIYENSKVILYTEEDNALYTRVPDVNGLDVAEAAKILLASNLNLKINFLSVTSDF